ncbi:hypothetical protein [Haloarchaeobius sp. HME9146]|uniref:DUF7535 family protein n=1 Tax=Haloarchaeobius sp. HME9146 TaxID=2978732 RepID=UPI0021C17DC8|nr:hypothetical protein [Haloarchaeobius sp. HME9146]MCT9095128.1 hypothetical protein [Haloarchaeobius sp. HME9146]
MATAEPEEQQPSTAKKALRTVTKLPGGHPNEQMSAVGLVMFGLLLVIMLPILPVIALVWLVGKVLESVRPK